MRGQTLIYFSRSVFAFAIIVCALVGYLFWDLSVRASARVALETSASAQTVQNEGASQVHTLAQDIQPQRQALDSLLNTDVLDAANTITAAGAVAGAQTAIGSASAEGVSSTGSSGVSALDFVAQAQGSFSQVFNAGQLFETLPLPSTVQELDFEYLPSSGSSKTGAWQLTAHIRVLTNANVSS